MRHQRARDRDALLLAAREPGRIHVRRFGEVDAREDLRDPFPANLRRQTARLEWEVQILSDGQVRPQREVLEHHRQVPMLRFNQDRPVSRNRAVPNDHRPLIGGRKTCQEAENGRLTAAGRPMDDYSFSTLDAKAQVMDCNPIPVELGDTLKFEGAHTLLPSFHAAKSTPKGTTDNAISSRQSAAISSGDPLAISVIERAVNVS